MRKYAISLNNYLEASDMLLIFAEEKCVNTQIRNNSLLDMEIKRDIYLKKLIDSKQMRLSIF